MRRLLSLVSLLAVAWAGYLPSPASALSPGLEVTGYTIDAIPPERSTEAYPLCGSRVDTVINVVFEYDPIPGCPVDGLMVRYSGFVTVPPGVSSVRFAIASDDGSHFTIDGTTFGSWADKGCSIDYADRREYPTGVPLDLEGWIYENGGGTCAMLFWQFNSDQSDWSIVPESAFAFGAPTTTTSTSTSTTSTSTSTTSTVAPTSTLGTPSSTQPEPEVPQTSPPPTATTTTSEPRIYQPPTSTASPTSTAAAPTSIQPTPIASSTSSSNPTTTVVTSAPTSTEMAPTTTTATTLLPSTTVPREATLSPKEAVTTATSAEAVAKLSEEEALAVFAAIDEGSLTLEEAAAIVDAVQSAPAAVRRAFESKVNIFGGKTDNYIPLFSTIPVGKRRTLIAATGMMTIVPPPRRRLR